MAETLRLDDETERLIEEFGAESLAFDRYEDDADPLSAKQRLRARIHLLIARTPTPEEADAMIALLPSDAETVETTPYLESARRKLFAFHLQGLR